MRVHNVYLQHGSDLSADVIAGRMAHAGFYVRVLVSPDPRRAQCHCHGRRRRDPVRTHSADETGVLQDEIMAELQGMRFRGGGRSWNSRSADDREPSCSEPQTP
jgi:hypothetical protein